MRADKMRLVVFGEANHVSVIKLQKRRKKHIQKDNGLDGQKSWMYKSRSGHSIILFIRINEEKWKFTGIASIPCIATLMRLSIVPEVHYPSFSKN